MLTVAHAKLADNLNSFAVPMLAVERFSPNEPFRYIAVNEAYVRLTKISKQEIYGRRPKDIFGQDDAMAVVRRFEACIASDKAMRFEEEIVFHDRTTTWDTTLLHVDMPGSCKRIIITSLPVGLEDDSKPISDLEFLVLQAQAQLEDLEVHLWKLEQYSLPSSDLRATADTSLKLIQSLKNKLVVLQMGRNDEDGVAPVVANGPRLVRKRLSFTPQKRV